MYLSSSNPNYQESVFTMVQHTLTGDFDELNVIAAVKLMEVVLQNCTGKVRGLSAIGLWAPRCWRLIECWYEGSCVWGVAGL